MARRANAGLTLIVVKPIVTMPLAGAIRAPSVDARPSHRDRDRHQDPNSQWSRSRCGLLGVLQRGGVFGQDRWRAGEEHGV